MDQAFDPADGRQLAAWAAILGAVMMVVTLVSNGIASGSDPVVFYDPAKALTLAGDKITAFRIYLLADIFGFYLPMIVTGTYLWRRLRGQAGIVIDMALFFLVIHVMLGAVGAGLQYAVIPGLVEVHAAGDAATRSSAEVAWLTTILGAARGIWLLEGPVIAFWGIATGRAMRAQGMKFGSFLMVVVVAYALSFISMCSGLVDLSNVFIVAAVLLQTVWTALLGFSLLREKSA